MTTSNSLLEQWEQFVQLVEESYDDNIDEYHFDLRVRDALETAVSSDTEPEWVMEKLSSLDERFRALLRPEPVRDDVPWWRGRVPRYAGEELAAAFRQWYGVEVEVR
ncbi:hypothetical protein [Saccharothrix australiensis]|uniref:Uncharacterized protein n=1 Tax=Saccharothrix australiensis TaxID=2072 RepID=A0A495VXQ2_9PSEU|nr:hypothetical protein [Saccharothrix australiensis]RKT53610.1 hypothetical protein C8E97_2182 [Saccharothrix australiensis]